MNGMSPVSNLLHLHCESVSSASHTPAISAWISLKKHKTVRSCAPFYAFPCIFLLETRSWRSWGSKTWAPYTDSHLRFPVSIYYPFLLRNCAQVLLIHDPKADKEAAAMDVLVGSLCDPPNLLGLAHFCEHMLFLGSGENSLCL